MTGNMGRLTGRARRVLALAEAAAAEFQHQTISTEHVLLSFVRDGGGVSGRVLSELGVTQQAVEEAIKTLPRGDERFPSLETAGLAPETKHMLELAAEEARRLKHHYLGVEHILLGMVAQADCTAVKILNQMNITPEQVRETLLRILQESPLPKAYEPLPKRLGAHVEHFNIRAIRVLAVAQDKAKAFGHDHVGAEHLFLGLILEQHGTAARALSNLNIRQQKVEELLRESTDSLDSPPVALPQISEADLNILERAIDEAKRSRQHLVDSVHLLFALIEQPDAKVLELLKHFEVTPQQVEEQLRLIIPSEKQSEIKIPAPTLDDKHRFTRRAQQILTLAQEAAERLKHNFIGTEHLLLALLREEGGVAGRVLRGFGLELSKTEAMIEELTNVTVHKFGEVDTDAPLELSPGSKRVLELAADEAQRTQNHYIGTEHLLLGLLRHNEGVAVDTLRRLDVAPEQLRRHLESVLQETSPPRTSQSSAPQSSSEQFSAPPLIVLALAQATAEEWQHDEVGVGHLIVGILRREKDLAARALNALGITPQRVEALVKASTPPYSGDKPSLHKLSLDSHRVLQLATDQARKERKRSIDTQHLLLGLAGQSAGIELLKQFDVSPIDIRNMLRKLANEPAVDAAIVPKREHVQLHSFEIIARLITKLLSMLEAQSLTLEQANELLSSFRPKIQLQSDKVTLTVSQVSELKVENARKIIIELYMNGVDAPAWEIALPATQALPTIKDLLIAAHTHSTFSPTIENFTVEMRLRLE